VSVFIQSIELNNLTSNNAKLLFLRQPNFSNADKIFLQTYCNIRSVRNGVIDKIFYLEVDVEVFFCEKTGDIVCYPGFEIELYTNSEYFTVRCLENKKAIIITSEGSSERVVLPKLLRYLHGKTANNGSWTIEWNVLIELFNTFLIMCSNGDQQISRSLSPTCCTELKIMLGVNGDYISEDQYYELWRVWNKYVDLLLKYCSYWNEGVIFGFATPAFAKQLLIEEKVGTFMIRIGQRTDVPQFSLKGPGTVVEFTLSALDMVKITFGQFILDRPLLEKIVITDLSPCTYCIPITPGKLKSVDKQRLIHYFTA